MFYFYITHVLFLQHIYYISTTHILYFYITHKNICQHKQKNSHSPAERHRNTGIKKLPLWFSQREGAHQGKKIKNECSFTAVTSVTIGLCRFSRLVLFRSSLKVNGSTAHHTDGRPSTCCGFVISRVAVKHRSCRGETSVVTR